MKCPHHHTKFRPTSVAVTLNWGVYKCRHLLFSADTMDSNQSAPRRFQVLQEIKDVLYASATRASGAIRQQPRRVSCVYSVRAPLLRSTFKVLREAMISSSRYSVTNQNPCSYTIALPCMQNENQPPAVDASQPTSGHVVSNSQMFHFATFGLWLREMERVYDTMRTQEEQQPTMADAVTPKTWPVESAAPTSWLQIVLSPELRCVQLVLLPCLNLEDLLALYSASGGMTSISRYIGIRFFGRHDWSALDHLGLAQLSSSLDLLSSVFEVLSTSGEGGKEESNKMIILDEDSFDNETNLQWESEKTQDVVLLGEGKFKFFHKLFHAIDSVMATNKRKKINLYLCLQNLRYDLVAIMDESPVVFSYKKCTIYLSFVELGWKIAFTKKVEEKIHSVVCYKVDGSQFLTHVTTASYFTTFTDLFDGNIVREYTPFCLSESLDRSRVQRKRRLRPL